MPQTKEEKRKAAQQRQEAHQKLTVEQKIQKLDSKLGKNRGANKERIRLINKTAKTKTK